MQCQVCEMSLMHAILQAKLKFKILISPQELMRARSISNYCDENADWESSYKVALELAQQCDYAEMIIYIFYEMSTNHEIIGNINKSTYYAQKALDIYGKMVHKSDFIINTSNTKIQNAINGCKVRIMNWEKQRRNDWYIELPEEKKLRILFKIIEKFAGEASVDTISKNISDEIAQALQIDRACTIVFQEPLLGSGSWKKIYNTIDMATMNELDISKCVLDKVIETREIFICTDAKYDKRVTVASIHRQFEGQIYCIPLISCDKLIGMIYADSKQKREALEESTINFMAVFSNIAASWIDYNAKHNQLLKERAIIERERMEIKGGFNEIIGESSAIQRLKEQITRISKSPLDILISGESGVGKELVAKALYKNGRRSSGPFIAIDCGSLTEGLGESELFGAKKGSYTGAFENRIGLIEAASGGILFLDEIGNLSFGLQGKLLRVLQEREIRRIGESKSIKVDVQILAATNRDLKREVKNGRFREDLYYRISTIQIDVPPLRTRFEDISLLASYFIRQANSADGKEKKAISEEALVKLQEYYFPGNVRELRNIIMSAFYRCPSSTITKEFIITDCDNLNQEENSDDKRVADIIIKKIEKEDVCFDEIVKKPFVNREISRGVVRAVISLALAGTAGRYKDALSRLGVPEKLYASTLVFLKRHGCYINYKQFR